MITVGALLKKSVQFAKEKNSAIERFEVELLLAHFLQIRRLDLYLYHDKPLQEKELQPIRSALKLLIQNQPLGYILGSVNFCGLQLKVTPAVLIPRQETELLVEHASRIIGDRALTVVDLCCGSGCIGLAVKARCKNIRLILSDISQEALQVAGINSQQLGLPAELKQGDLLENIQLEEVDVLLSNPPYIREEEYAALAPEVRDYEPKLALVSGATGLEMYEKIYHTIAKYNRDDLMLGLEIGYTQAQQVLQLFSPHFGSHEIIRDFNGHNRHLFFKK